MKPVCLFDLDGTLTNPQAGIVACIEHAFHSLGRRAPDRAELRGWIGPPLQESFHQALGTHLDAERALGAYRERFDEIGWRENELVPEMPELLSDLAGLGARCRVVTSKPQVFASRIVEHFGLDRWFEGVFGSELDGRRTGKAELIRYCVEDGDIPASAAVMIGDRRHDVDGALACGIASVGVLWGFGSRAELLRAGADHVVSRPLELIVTIEQMITGGTNR
ncbi:MAG: HAD hydrolase-like protein [Xanthomonadales bacterium]|nr:HAD hydrolase-like protein [Xanthomonadales bacterium]